MDSNKKRFGVIGKILRSGVWLLPLLIASLIIGIKRYIGGSMTFEQRMPLLAIILMPLEALEILKIIRDITGAGEWIFTRDTGRITERQANYILEKYSASLGKKTKFAHTLRKTCGSDMRRAGFTTRQCADYLGNSERVFLDHYSFDTETDEEYLRRLDSIGKTREPEGVVKCSQTEKEQKNSGNPYSARVSA